MSILEPPKYSIVIAPPQIEIGWYNSRNSKAHITIVEFTSDEDELVYIIDHLKEIASYETPMHLNFDGVDKYSNGAVFLKPDVATKTPLTDLMVRIQKDLKIKNSYKSKDPHISIGRKLSEENVEIALKMFADVKLAFNCSDLILRKFNTVKKQYDYFSEDFIFLGMPQKPNPQQSLF
jgi:2'-5' RNA ligase